jgi:hypothetical protein
VFFFWAGDTDFSSPLGQGASSHVAPCPPVGWAEKSITLSHCEVGGATSVRWTIQVWYPTGAVVFESVVLDPLPWLPIRCSVSDRESAAAVALAHLPADLPPVAGVVRQDVGVRRGIVQQWGLFPASDLSSHVLLAATGSVSGMGVPSSGMSSRRFGMYSS